VIRILTHALVIPVDAPRRILIDGALAFDDRGLLLAVGPTEDVVVTVRGCYEPAEVIVEDLSGRVIIPGFVDVHIHLGEQLMRGLVPDWAAPDEWLPRWLLPGYACLTPMEERLGAELAIAEMLLTGTTTFGEAGTLMEWEPVADAVQSSGIRGQLGRWTWDLPAQPQRMRHTTSSALTTMAELVSGVRGLENDRLTASCTLLGMGTASEDLLRQTDALSTDLGTPKAMMWAGTAPEHGGSVLPAAQLAEWGWTSAGTKLTHAVYLERNEVDVLATGGATVAHCPTAALRHVKGISRHGLVPEMLAAGIAVGLGGDSANGSNHFNMLKLAGLAATLYKDFRMDQTMVPPETALEMATIHGARCLGLEDQVGSLEVGKRADFVVFSTDHPEWRPMIDPVQNLILNASDRSIESVWVDGRRIVCHGVVETLDLPAVLAAADTASRDLLGRADLTAQWTWTRS
jgi:5-methylthioadenosine/S-adenosylhomocysteine deaminase